MDKFFKDMPNLTHASKYLHYAYNISMRFSKERSRLLDLIINTTMNKKRKYRTIKETKTGKTEATKTAKRTSRQTKSNQKETRKDTRKSQGGAKIAQNPKQRQHME